MAQFISIPVTSKGTTLISTEGLCTTFSNATTLVFASAGKTLTLTITGSLLGAPAIMAAVNDAVTKLNGPTVVPVTFPAGVTCTAITIE